MQKPLSPSPLHRYLYVTPVDLPAIDGSGVVHWNYCGLKFIREDLMRNEEFRKTKNFLLNRNSLRTLPENINLLSQLVSLHIKANELQSLPDGIGGLKSLEILDVCSNCLQELPRSIGQLVNLKRLYVSHNELRQLPTEIGHLTKLETLDSVRNHLVHVPLSLGNCGQLRRLALDSNNIVEYPRQLCGFDNLQELSLSSNNLEWLPQNIGNMESLQHLYVDNNPGLMALPCSTEHLKLYLGFQRCAVIDYKKQTVGHVVTFRNNSGVQIQVSLPREIETVCHPSRTCVPSLVELGLRSVAQQRDYSSQEHCEHSKTDVKQYVIHDELPKDLQETLYHPTAQCFTCENVVFRSAFPVVFNNYPMYGDDLFLGLCCSLSCLLQSEVVMRCPLVYPYTGYIHHLFI